ncbi:MAG: acyloxyacyl hydrolase [Planctomycetes bacterium]|nr:acyloxyacyl hydrolase [Planctomycetota bacterium]
MRIRRRRLALAVQVGLLLIEPAACVAHALPVAGERSLELRPYYGVPILQKSLLWDGNGETDDAGAKLRHLWHLTDDLAIGGGLTAAVWLPGGHDILAGELEAVGRCYCLRRDTWGWFGEAAGGYVHSTDPIPPGGTEWNFTFSFGTGIEMPLQRDLDLQTGITYHHISNALGRENDRNPSQNEAQLWLGIAWRF